MRNLFSFKFRSCLQILCGAILFGAAAIACAAPIGAVEYVNGILVLQRAQLPPRIIATTQALDEGDILTTSADSYAIIKLQDGTQMTLRADTKLVMSHYIFRTVLNTKDGVKDDSSMLLQLIKGGLRTVTGMISKRTPDSAKIETAAGTIGIRGTDFDVRLCGKDCQTEAKNRNVSNQTWNIAASARVIRLESQLSAVNQEGNKRNLSLGGPIYPGDTLETGNSGYAVIAFRDGSKVTLQPSTRFRVDDFVYDEKNAREGRFLVSLLKGGMRGLTGLIGKANSSNVTVQTRNTLVGVQGTEYSLLENGSVSVQSGKVQLKNINPDKTCLPVIVDEGNSVKVFNPCNTSAPSTATPAELIMTSPLPSTVEVDLNKLFGIEPHDDSEPGLYVYVRDGHIQVVKGSTQLDLGKGEFGYVAFQGAQMIRPDHLAGFIVNDATPLPNKPEDRGALLFEPDSAKQQCR